MVMLDAKNRVIRTEILSVGTLDASIAHPREIFRAATLASASAIVVFHNHPSGDPQPSPDDVALTHRLRGAGRSMGIAWSITSFSATAAGSVSGRRVLL